MIGKENSMIQKLILKVVAVVVVRVMDVNLRSILFLSQFVAKDMVERGEGGSIVNVSSQASLCAIPEHTVYCE